MNPSCVQYCTLICSKTNKTESSISSVVELSITQRQSIKRMQRLHLLSFYNKSYYSTIIFLLFIIYYLLLLLICKHIFVRSFVRVKSTVPDICIDIVFLVSSSYSIMLVVDMCIFVLLF
jgi:hypothetical protein